MYNCARRIKNIGIDKLQIAIELKKLFADATHWIDNKIYPPDEIAVRFKQKIVSIHCFSNGNGRHSRLMADTIIEKIYKKPIFSWGTNNLAGVSDLRSVYIKAIKAADKGNYTLHLAFARS